MYYNHDSLNDIPNKLCFKKNGDIDYDTCIDSDHLEMLKGTVGMKLNSKNKNDTSNENYLVPYYIDFREKGVGIGATKDQLFFKDESKCANSDLFYNENSSFDNEKYPLYSHLENEIGCDDFKIEDCFKDKDETKKDISNLSNEGRMCPKKCGMVKTIIEGSDTEWGWTNSNQLLSPNSDAYELDIETKTGWYKIRNDIDKDYNGYYINNSNNNSRYKVKSNAINIASRSKGNISDNHRASHDGDCSQNELSDSKDIANRVFFCGHKRNRLLFKGLCNPTMARKEEIAEGKQCSNNNEIIPYELPKPTTIA